MRRKSTHSHARRAKFLGFFSYSYQQIIQTQGLLAHAVKTGDKAEETRLRRGLTELVEKVE